MLKIVSKEEAVNTAIVSGLHQGRLIFAVVLADNPLCSLCSPRKPPPPNQSPCILATTQDDWCSIDFPSQAHICPQKAHQSTTSKQLDTCLSLTKIHNTSTACQPSEFLYFYFTHLCELWQQREACGYDSSPVHVRVSSIPPACMQPPSEHMDFHGCAVQVIGDSKVLFVCGCVWVNEPFRVDGQTASSMQPRSDKQLLSMFD